jgi:hypothetical protein
VYNNLTGLEYKLKKLTAILDKSFFGKITFLKEPKSHEYESSSEKTEDSEAEVQKPFHPSTNNKNKQV